MSKYIHLVNLLMGRSSLLLATLSAEGLKFALIHIADWTINPAS